MSAAHGPSPLPVTGILYNNSRHYIEEVFKAYQDGRIVVPIKNREAAEQMAGLRFENIVETRKDSGWLQLPHQLNYSDDIAQISYTSGTQGEPKGIMLSHRNLADTIRRLNAVMGLQESVREYVGVPVYHSFGFGRIRACMAVGGHAYIPEHGFNPLEMADMLKAGEINAVSAVPTLWRLVLDESHIIGDLGTRVKWIEIGSQYMAREEKEEMKLLFPNAWIIQHYGLTEASRTSFLDITRTRGEALESVGKATDGVEVRLNDQDVIEVRGDHVARYILTSAGITPLTDEQGWFQTSDKGRIENDYLYFMGRADDVINCGGIKIAADFLERALLDTLGRTKGIAVCKVKDRVRGNGILVTIESGLEDHLDQIKAITRDELAKLNVRAGEALHFDVVEKLPVTDTGKLRRKTIGEAFEARHPDLGESKPKELEDSYNKDLREICQAKLDVGPIKPSDSIIGIGVDSLSLVIASLEVEEYLGYLPDNWMGLTFTQLEALKEEADMPVKIPSKRKPLLVIGFILLFLFLGEFFLQARSHIKTGRSALNHVTDQSTIIFNQELGVRTYRPFRVLRDNKTGKERMRINSLGLRSPEIGDRTANEIRIAVVGASTVAGARAKDNKEVFSQILADLIQADSHRPVNVINGGVPGLTLGQIGKLTSGIVIPLKPSMIIIYTGFNDIAGICNADEKQRSQPWRPPTFGLPRWIMSREMIRMNTTFLRSQPLLASNFVDPKDVDLSSHRIKLEKMVSGIREHGIEPVLVTNARSYINVQKEKQAALAASSLFYYSCLNLEGVIEVGEMYNQLIKDVAAEYNAQLIDLGAVMPGGKDYFVDGGHFNLKGEKYVAQTIYEATRQRLLQ